MLGWYQRRTKGYKMDQQDLVDLWVGLDKQIKDLVRQKEAVEAALGPQEPGTKLEGREKRLLVRDKRVLKPAELESHVTPYMWRRITKRIPVADLLKAEIKRGNIDQDIVNDCSGRSKYWFETTV